MRGLLAFKPHTKKLQSITSPCDCLKEHKTEKNSPGLSTWVQMLQDTWIKSNNNDIFLLLVSEKNKVTHYHTLPRLFEFRYF